MENKNPLFMMIEPKEYLKSSIISAIKREETKRTIYKIAFSSLTSMISVFIATVSVFNIIKDAHQSGLSEYLSLIFSDGVLLASYWQTYVMSVAESLPIIPITIVVASIGVSVWSINKALLGLKNTRLVFYKA